MMRGIAGRVMRGASIERGLESTRALRKWVVLGLAIGVVAGFGAVLFYSALEWATKLLIGGIAGYHPAEARRRGADRRAGDPPPLADPRRHDARRADRQPDRLPLRARGGGARHGRRHRLLPSQGRAGAPAHPADQADRLRDHHRLGRQRRARGAGGADFAPGSARCSRPGCASRRATGASPSRRAWGRASARSSAPRSAAR